MDLLQLLETTQDNVFLTGVAGSGKSSTLRQLVRKAGKSVIVCAPTGVAAINARGQTIHSLFRIPPRMLNDDDIKEIAKKQSNVIKHAKKIIIDEMGFVRGDMLDALDRIMRLARHQPNKPFGGCPILGVGDQYQLPPIVSGSEKEHFDRLYESPYFFSSNVAQESPFKIVELTNVFRQTDLEFIRILNDIRSGVVSKEDLDNLNQCVRPADPGAIVLCPYNAQVQQINEEALLKLPGEVRSYQAVVDGDFPKGGYPNDETVSLKVGTTVMLLRNEAEDFNKFLYVNGTIAKVTALAEKIVDVEIPGKGVHRIEFAEWDSIKYDMLGKTLTHRVSGSFSQIPMKLAAAFSIHKSQSKTFDKVHINMGKGAFDYGQAYVALSRCRTLDGMSLEKPLARRDVMIDPRITEYFRAAKEAGLVTEVSQAFDERMA